MKKAFLFLTPCLPFASCATSRLAFNSEGYDYKTNSNAQLKKYNFLLVYQCQFLRNASDSNHSGKLRNVAKKRFRSDMYYEIIGLDVLGYDDTEVAV